MEQPIALLDPGRFWRYVIDRSDPDACWLWGGSIGTKGYGRHRDYRVAGYQSFLAHRVAYTLAVGPIPKGLVIDHLCRVRSCVNPRHLEPVTNGENIRRGLRNPKRREVIDGVPYCKAGHAVVGDNVRPASTGGVACKQCHRERGAEYMRRKRARASQATAKDLAPSKDTNAERVAEAKNSAPQIGEDPKKAPASK